MLKTVVASLLISSSAWALDFKVIGPCSDTPMAHTSVPATATTLGDLTIGALTSLGLPFTGDRSGISSIASSPRGDEALEVLSDTQMRAYGWCVEIDGTQPDVMPDEVQVTPATKSVTWFYAYSVYDAGVWKDYCSPSWKIRTLNVCKK